MRVPKPTRLLFGAMAAMGVLAVAGCGGNVLGPDNQLQLTNAADNFQWQATNLDNVGQTLTYDWTMTGTAANVDQSSSVTGGSATLTIQDDAGTVVYTASLGQNGTFTTDAGVAGTWRIEVKMSGATGTLNFRVQKP
jgi:hypothetical protein